MGLTSQLCRGPRCPSRWRGRTTGRWSVRRRGVDWSWGIGRFPRTAKPSMTPLRLTGQTVRQRTCTIRINERRAAQVFRAPGDSVSAEVGSDIELEIQPYDGDGLSFSSHDLRTPQNIKFDGHDHPNAGPDVPSGSASSGRRMNRRGVEITNKIR